MQALRRHLPLRIFFETGTFEARTTALVAPHFDQVYTVELSRVLHERATQRLAGNPHVEVILGSSPEALRARAPQLRTASVLYWLDAHWCGGVTGGVEDECPVLAELDAIGSLNNESVVLIDDARFFLAPPPAPHNPAHWPRLDQLQEALRHLASAHALWAINDVLIYAPLSVTECIIEYGREHGIDLASVFAEARAARSVKGIARRTWHRMLGRIAGAKDDALAEPRHSADAAFEKGFNRALLSQDRSERIFAFHARRLGTTRLLDIGSNSGQFAAKMRRLGYQGLIYSVEPQASAHSRLREVAQNDTRWIPLPRQALGRERSFMTLNVADNSWSSSFLPVHGNHLRAAPQTRTVRTERVLVTKSADVLRAPIMAQIDAVKIDVQGFEMEVLQGLRSQIAGVRLLLLEMSLVECYVGAPDMFALDRFLVGELGFGRVSLEPSYYDDSTGTVQQYDGIYAREVAHPAGAHSQIVAPQIGAVYTSMHGVPARTGPDGRDCGRQWLDLCVQSWRGVSPNIVSLSEVEPLDPRVQWQRSSSRPSLAELFAAMDCSNATHTLLCNADIQIVADKFEAVRLTLDPHAVYLSQREDVKFGTASADSLVVKSTYLLGFDLFILPADFVRHVVECQALPVEFRVGEPWWDYLVPLVALAAGFPVKRLPPADVVARHYAHPARYHQSTWIERGQQFLATLANLAAQPDCRATALFDEIAALPGDPKDKLHAASRLICASLP